MNLVNIYNQEPIKYTKVKVGDILIITFIDTTLEFSNIGDLVRVININNKGKENVGCTSCKTNFCCFGVEKLDKSDWHWSCRFKFKNLNGVDLV